MKKHFIILIIGLVSAFYLFNPGAGIFELVPDNIPVFGNLDEATAAYLFFACLRYFKLDVVNIFRKKR